MHQWVNWTRKCNLWCRVIWCSRIWCSKEWWRCSNISSSRWWLHHRQQQVYMVAWVHKEDNSSKILNKHLQDKQELVKTHNSLLIKLFQLLLHHKHNYLFHHSPFSLFLLSKLYNNKLLKARKTMELLKWYQLIWTSSSLLISSQLLLELLCLLRWLEKVRKMWCQLQEQVSQYYKQLDQLPLFCRIQELLNSPQDFHKTTFKHHLPFKMPNL